MTSNCLAKRNSGEWLSVILLAFIVSLWMSAAMAGEVPTTDRQPATAEQRARVVEAFGRSPLHFEPNQGQAAAGVKFVARTPGYQLLLTPTAAVLALRGKDQPTAVRMQLIGAAVNPQPVVEGFEALTGRSHYYRGNDPQQWQANVPHFAKVRYSQVYPGVDWVLYGNPRQLEYDFVVAPGTDPSVIQLSLAGADQVRLAEDGHLVAAVAGREVLHSSPTIYQVVKGERQIVAGRYVLRDSVENAPVVGFEIAAYDRELPLVIDPVVYFTFVGGAPDDDSGVGGDDRGLSIAVDSAGNAYITGSTSTNNANIAALDKKFPTTSLAINEDFSDGTDAFVTRIDAAGTIIYSTYFGGSAFDVGYGIAVDDGGNAYITGSTNSGNFPNRSSADLVNESNGITITTSSKLPDATPGTLYPTVTFAATQAPDTWSLDPPEAVSNLPTSMTFSNGNLELVNPTIPPTAAEAGTYSFIVKATREFDNGTTVVTQTARKTFTLKIIAKFQGVNDQLRGTQDAFVAKIGAGGLLDYSFYLGGTGNEAGYGIAVNTSGQAYVTGYTTSVDDSTATPPSVGFPYGVDSADKKRLSANKSEDAFVVKVNYAGDDLMYSRLTGFAGNDRGQGIVLDSAGTSAYITGFRNSPTNEAAFVAKFSDDTGTMGTSAMLDGTGNERGLAIDRDNLSPTGIYITGSTSSLSGIATTGAYDTTFNGPTGSQDAFIAKYTDTTSAFTLNYATYLGGYSNDVGYGIAVDSLGNAYVAGETFSPNFPMVGPDDADPAKGEAFLVRLTGDVTDPPTIAGSQLTYSSFWGGAENDSGRGLAKDFANDMYMVGYTNSPKDKFSLGAITPYRDYSGGADAFVAKFSIPLSNTDFNLSVKFQGSGSGEVISIPEGIGKAIPCGLTDGKVNTNAVCDAAYATGTKITLTAVPGESSQFAGWSGSGSGTCTGSSALTCELPMDQPRQIVANFSKLQELTVEKLGTGSGTVTSNPAGINCGADCSEAYQLSTLVTLTAATATGSVFTGWSGACAGTAPTCVVTMAGTRKATATFALSNTLTVTKTGTGTVTSSPAGISCGTTCSASYPENTAVTLNSSSVDGWKFDRWTGDCTGSGACSVTMDAAKSVTANFIAVAAANAPDLQVDKLTADPSTQSQRMVSFSLTVANQGQTPAGSFKTRFYPSTDQTIDPKTDILATTGCSFANGLAATVTQSCQGSLMLPNGLAAGTYYLGAYVDPDNLVPESDENNNGRSAVSTKDPTKTLTLNVLALDVTKTGTGNGKVVSIPLGVNCGTTPACSKTSVPFLTGSALATTATLTATAATGSTFTGWSGGVCTGTGSCIVTLDKSKTVTATFELK